MAQVLNRIDGHFDDDDLELLEAMTTDGTGDTLDCVLCLVQAAWAWMRRDAGYGLPLHIDPVEGWIVGVTAPERGAVTTH